MKIASNILFYGLINCILAFAFPTSSHCQNTLQEQHPFFQLPQVSLQSGVLKNAQEVNTQTLLLYIPDRLLAPYLKEAGLTPKAQSYTNWIGLDGHIAGHYLSALAANYAATGNVECKKRLLYMLTELRNCQLKHQNGYVGGVPNSKNIWQALQKGNMAPLKQAWVPWYNLHKMYAGLRDAWTITGIPMAKEMFLDFCNWGFMVTEGLSDSQMEQMLQTEHGGMNEVFADAYELTHETKYLQIAKRFSHKTFLQPLMAGKDVLDNLHANTQIPKVIGFAKIAALTGDTNYYRAASFFWQIVVQKRSIAIGGNSTKEFFPAVTASKKYIEEREGPESCNTYNMLKLTKVLFAMHPLAMYADFYERALFNHILSTQHPQHGGYVYFTPARPQHYRVYSAPNQAMWCCVGSGMENHTKYGEFIYAHQRDSLYVNLFVPSSLHWKERSMHVLQQTKFPFQESSQLTIQTPKPNKFTLLIRYPYWVAPGKLQVLCNGKPFKTNALPSTYISLSRIWHNGDVVTLRLPMSTRLESLPQAPEYVAIMHGPIVLGAKTSTQQLDGLVANDGRWAHIPHGRLMPLKQAPILLKDYNTIASKLIPIPNQPLHFKAQQLCYNNAFSNLELQPFFQIHDARYMMYWLMLPDSVCKQVAEEIALQEKRQLALDERTIDVVIPGQQQPEADHKMKMLKTASGVWNDAFYRNVQEGGSLEYELVAKKGVPTNLLIRFWGNEVGRRQVKIYVDGVLIANENITDKWKNNAFVDVEYAIPNTIMLGKQPHSIKIESETGATTGGIYLIALVKK